MPAGAAVVCAAFRWESKGGRRRDRERRQGQRGAGERGDAPWGGDGRVISMWNLEDRTGSQLAASARLRATICHLLPRFLGFRNIPTYYKSPLPRTTTYSVLLYAGS